jgi:hypothetical protein
MGWGEFWPRTLRSAEKSIAYQPTENQQRPGSKYIRAA